MADNNVVIDMRSPFRDERGEILNLLDEPIGSVSRIESHAGSVRANHYHKTDHHYCFLQTGEVEYYHRPVGSHDDPVHHTIRPGQLFFTPHMYEHTMVFTKDS